MLHLPVCPYCSAVYYYRDVRAAARQETARCHHCRKKFGVRAKSRRAGLIAGVALVLMTIDIGLLYLIPTINLTALYLITLCLLALSLFLTPYAVRFVPLDKKERK